MSDRIQCTVCEATYGSDGPIYCLNIACPARNPARRPEPDEPDERPAVRIITITNPGYDVVLFFDRDGGAEAVISGPDVSLPTKVRIAPPESGRRIVVERNGDLLSVSYKDDET